ncbi:MAG: hypothetical protein ACAH59_13465 [Pseudobdellovibrionaceae bacterium]
MIFSENEDLGKLSHSLIHLGFLMAQGNPQDPKAQKLISKLARVLQKIDLEGRLMDNLRFFQGTGLNEAQKLRVYEVLIKTLSQIQKGRGYRQNLNDAGECPQEVFQSWRQKVELQRGAWTGFALLVGAIIASTETCEKWLQQYGLRIGVYLELQEEVKKINRGCTLRRPWVQSPEQISLELSSILNHLKKDLSEASLAYQFLNNFGLKWSHSLEEQPH